MPGPKVFVSYSHKDEKALEQLQRFLNPLERDGLIDAWADTRLVGGDDWKREIDKSLDEATVAVLLISQDFLNSKFITEEEVPRVLAREAARKMTVLPVFLSPSFVDETEYAVPGTGDKVRLTRFQGYGKPNQPLSELEWSQRDRIYKEIALRLRTLAGLAPPVSPLTSSASTPTAAAGPARLFELTVQLERRGESLQIQYHRPGLEPIASASHPWADFGSKIESFHRALDTALNRALQPEIGKWGDVLFDLLFGPAEQWEPILRAVFGRPAGTPRPNPVFGPVRLRIHTEDAHLTGLPWRLTSWKGQPLIDAGWTFTTTHMVDPVDDRLITAPANVLVVAPRTAGTDGGPHDPEHARAVLDVLKKAWPTERDPGYVQIARTRTELEEGLRGLRPAILYIYARGGTGGRPSLLLEGGPPLTLADLRRLCSEHNPAVVYLNTEGLADGDGVTPDQILGDGVPLLLWRRRPEWSAESTTVALHWLSRWLTQGEDPVAAFHQVQRDTYPPSCEVHTLAIHSNYRTWRTSTFQTSAQRHYPSLRLDRNHQKSLVRKYLEELVRSGSRRVMALVPYGAEGNAIPSLSEGLRHDLELSLSHLAEISWVRLQFPETRSNLRHDLEEELKLQLGAQPNEPVRYLLRRHAPRAVPPGKKPVLWLDWGNFGKAKSLQPELKDKDLEAWLQFSSEFLGTQCPDDLRIVSYAALEVPNTEYESIADQLKEQRRQPWCRTPAFRLSELPPLGKVAEADLLDFLEDPDNSSCDPGIQIEIAERIVTKTGGDFEETVALLQNAENGSWYDVLADLRREQGGL